MTSTTERTLSPGPLGLSGPSWATEHEEMDGGIRWWHAVNVEIQSSTSTAPDAEPDQLPLRLAAQDSLQVHGNALVLVREPACEIYIEDWRLTPKQARAFADALVTLADVLEAQR